MSEHLEHPDSSSLPSQDSGVAADSVVPSLMQVYNTMVLSKTPEGGPRLLPIPAQYIGYSGAGDLYQTAAAAAAAASGHCSVQHPTTAAEWNAYTVASSTGNASLPAIPPIPHNAYGSEDATDSGSATAEPSITTSMAREETSSSMGARTLRKRSNASLKEESPPSSVASGRNSKVRRKAKETDGRWSKRFSWPEDLHRDFVSAIFDVGLKHSSPSTLLEHMPKHEQITSERIKSHLQKYRLHRVKSKKEFMSSYDSGLKKINKDGTQAIRSMAAGEVASYLSHNIIHDKDPSAEPPNNPQSESEEPATVEVEEKKPTEVTKENQEFLTLPRLTEEEKQSPLGASMGYLMGLFFSLKQQLVAQRAADAAAAAIKEEKANKTTPAAAVYDSFVAGPDTAMLAAPNTISSSSGNGGNNPAAPATVVSTNPSTRSNLEENNMMKREMQNQMAFQNKMRGLKQQELNKFRNTDDRHQGSSVHDMISPAVGSATGGGGGGATIAAATTSSTQISALDSERGIAVDSLQQGAGETAADGGGTRRIRGLSLGGAEEFWNTDVVDEQLFEFLMSEP